VVGRQLAFRNLSTSEAGRCGSSSDHRAQPLHQVGFAVESGDIQVRAATIAERINDPQDDSTLQDVA